MALILPKQSKMISRRSLLLAAPAVVASRKLGALPFGMTGDHPITPKSERRRLASQYDPNCPICTGKHTVQQVRDGRLRRLELAELEARVIRAQFGQVMRFGFCNPQLQAAPGCRTPFFRDFSTVPFPTNVINPQRAGQHNIA